MEESEQRRVTARPDLDVVEAAFAGRQPVALRRVSCGGRPVMPAISIAMRRVSCRATVTRSPIK